VRMYVWRERMFMSCVHVHGEGKNSMGESAFICMFACIFVCVCVRARVLVLG